MTKLVRPMLGDRQEGVVGEIVDVVDDHRVAGLTDHWAPTYDLIVPGVKLPWPPTTDVS